MMSDVPFYPAFWSVQHDKGYAVLLLPGLNTVIDQAWAFVIY